MPLSLVHGKEGQGGGEGGIWRSLRGGKEEIAIYVGMMQLTQQHVAPCVKEVEWGFVMKGSSDKHDFSLVL